MNNKLFLSVLNSLSMITINCVINNTVLKIWQGTVSLAILFDLVEYFDLRIYRAKKNEKL